MNPPRLLLVSFVLTLVAVLGLGARTALVHPPVVTSLAPVAATPEVRAAAVLEAWDTRRSRAWSSGRPAALGALYVPGASAGRADVSMLRAWRSRGLRVSGLRTQLLALRVVSSTRSALVVRVTDRIVSAVAESATARRALPADRPSSYVISLRLVGGAWKVASVRPA